MFDLESRVQPQDTTYDEPRGTPLSEDEETMQAYVEGKWHRRFLQRSETACGQPFHSQRTALRREALDGDLCGDCFTIRELAENKRLEAEKYSQSDVIDDK